MSYYHPDIHGALRAHHEEAQHRLVNDPVDLPAGATVGALTYHNGPTIPQPKLVALYSGAFWGDRGKNDQFLKELMEYGYLAGFTSQGTNNGQFLGSFNIPAPHSSTVADADCQAMIRAAIGKNGVPAADANTLFMLILPDGVTSVFEAGGSDSSCNTYCAYHSNAADPFLYTVQPANTCAGCNQGNAQDGLQMTEAHETVEACTDPTGQGWYNDQTGAENADETAWIAVQYGPWTVQGAACKNAASQWVNTVGAYTPTPNPPPPSGGCQAAALAIAGPIVDAAKAAWGKHPKNFYLEREYRGAKTVLDALQGLPQ